MNFKIRNIIPVGFAVLLASCSQQQARRPLTQNSGQFMKESMNRNINLIAIE